MKFAFVALALIAVVGPALYLASAGRRTTASRPQASARPPVSSVSLPLFFEANQGQTDPRVKFMARGRGYGLFLTADEAVLELQGSAVGRQPSANSVIRMRLAGANTISHVSGAQPLPGKSNYFIGNDPKKWRHNVPQFARVEYSDVYPGVDLAYYGHQGQLEYDFRVAPGADSSRIAMSFEGASAHLDSGDLVLSTGQGDIRFHAPSVYQPDGDKQLPVEGRFLQLADNRIGFEVGAYDRSRELVIDPVLSYSTYLGGTGVERLTHIAADSGLNMYVAGSTTSGDFPGVSGTFQTSNHGADDIFIAKIDATGSTLVYATYLGGSQTELLAGVAVDSGFNVYVAGTTFSNDFPTSTNGFQTSASGIHGFLSKLDLNALNLIYSTYLAGNGIDTVTGLAIDSGNNAFVTGNTTSTDAATGFPATTTGYQTSSLATTQFFASKINTAGSGATSMLYSTYFGGTSPVGATAAGGGIALDASGNMYITGTTNFIFDPAAATADPRTNFPILNAQQACLNQAPTVTACDINLTGHTDAFVAGINPNRPNGAGLLYSTYLGGSDNDTGLSIAVDSASSAHVTGETFSSDWSVHANNYFGGGDAFVAKITKPSGTNTIFPLTFFTFIGGSNEDIGRGIAVDAVQAAHVTGSTSSGDLHTTNPVQGFGGVNDAFVALIPTGGAAGTYVTFLGGGGFDQGTGVALDPNRESSPTFVAGETQSGNFPRSANPVQSGLSGSQDAFVSVIGSTSTFSYLPPPAVDPTVSPSPASVGNAVTFTFTFVNNGPDPASNVSFIGTYATSGVTFTSASSSPGTCQNPASGKVTCSIGAVPTNTNATVTIVLTPTIGTTSLSVAPTLSANGGAFLPFAAGTVQVNDFSIKNPPPAPSSVTITAGQSTSFVVTLTPIGAFTSTISMSPGTLPTGVTGTFTSPTITLNGAASQTTTLNIATTARPVVTGSLFHGGPLYATWLPVGGLGLLGLGVGAGVRRRRWLAGALLGLVAGIILLQPACGSSNSTPPATGGTPAGTYTINISASSGSDSHTASVTLIVQ
jgi:uncharacterized repeat protein (TIGR01451 family)